jgi:hypothetical protein
MIIIIIKERWIGRYCFEAKPRGASCCGDSVESVVGAGNREGGSLSDSLELTATCASSLLWPHAPVTRVPALVGNRGRRAANGGRRENS